MDAGGALGPEHTHIQDAEWAQREVKAELILDAIARIGVDAMTVGQSDFTFGRDFLMREATERKLPYLVANLVDSASGTPLFDGSKVVQVGTLKVGLLGVTSEELRVEGLKVLDPVEAARKEAAALKSAGAELIIALSNQSAAAQERLADEVPELSMIVVGGANRKSDPPTQQGDTLILEAGNKGKFVGFLDVTYQPGATGWASSQDSGRIKEKRRTYQERMKGIEAQLAQEKKAQASQAQPGDKSTGSPASVLRLERQLEFYQKELQKLPSTGDSDKPLHRFAHKHEGLSRQVKDDPVVGAMVKDALKRIEDPTLKATSSRPSLVGAALPSGQGDFVGAQTCMSCHLEEYRQWKNTPHAHAWQTLVKASRSQDFQCFGCHVTGHGQPGGPTSPETVGHLENVQCESCHTAGRSHVMDPAGHKLPAAVPESTCVSCHTPEQTDGEFKYADALPGVIHRVQARVPSVTTKPH